MILKRISVVKIIFYTNGENKILYSDADLDILTKGFKLVHECELDDKIESSEIIENKNDDDDDDFADPYFIPLEMKHETNNAKNISEQEFVRLNCWNWKSIK